MIALLITLILLQPPVEPPPTPEPTPIINPCLNMLPPIEGAMLPNSWIMPDGTDCTPYEIIEPDDIEDAPAVGTPPAPTQATDTLGWLMNLMRRARFGQGW